MSITNKYIPLLIIISGIVATLMHFPEIVSLVDADPANLFPDMTAPDVLSEVFFTFISLLILFAINIYLFGFGRIISPISWKRILLAFVATWIINSLLGKGFFLIHQWFNIPAVDAIIHYNLHPLRDFIITFIVIGCSYILYLVRHARQVESENQQLQAENLLNQYEALKNQLNPHMLFNSLNTLRSLIRETPARAQDFLQELSRVLRYTLQEHENGSVTLKEEMEFVNSFIFLLKMRYEENLIFDIDIRLEDENCLLPPMSIQLLVENAVKHNEISNRHPFKVQLSSDGERFTVNNPVQPKRTPYVGAGIGLANLAKRYQLLFKKDITIKEENKNFTVSIPLI